MSDEKPTPRERYIEPPSINDPLRLTPGADLNEARAQEPRRLWPLLSHVESRTTPPSDGWGWAAIVALGTALLMVAVRC